MVKSVDPAKATNYLVKSEELLATANDSLKNKRYNSAVTSAVHSSINALDALTTKFKGKRDPTIISKQSHLLKESFFLENMKKLENNLYI